MQITVPLNEIVELINPVKLFIIAKAIKHKQITNVILDITVYFFITIVLSVFHPLLLFVNVKFLSHLLKSYMDTS